MSALTQLESKRFNSAARLCDRLASQQKARAIDGRIVRRAARTLIAAGLKPTANMKRIAQYGKGRHAQQKKQAD